MNTLGWRQLPSVWSYCSRNKGFSPREGQWGLCFKGVYNSPHLRPRSSRYKLQWFCMIFDCLFQMAIILHWPPLFIPLLAPFHLTSFVGRLENSSWGSWNQNQGCERGSVAFWAPYCHHGRFCIWTNASPAVFIARWTWLSQSCKAKVIRALVGSIWG